MDAVTDVDPVGTHDVIACACGEPAVAVHTREALCQTHLEWLNMSPQHGGADGSLAWCDRDGLWHRAQQYWHQLHVAWARDHPLSATAVLFRDPEGVKHLIGQPWPLWCEASEHEPGWRDGRARQRAMFARMPDAAVIHMQPAGRYSRAYVMPRCGPCAERAIPEPSWLHPDAKPRVPPVPVLEWRDGVWVTVPPHDHAPA
jgi:hypothetical protein